jgi:hypothetical protein
MFMTYCNREYPTNTGDDTMPSFQEMAIFAAMVLVTVFVIRKMIRFLKNSESNKPSPWTSEPAVKPQQDIPVKPKEVSSIEPETASKPSLEERVVAATTPSLEDRLVAATTLDDFENIYQEAPSGSDVEMQAIKRHSDILLAGLGSIPTVDELVAVRGKLLDDSTDAGSDLCRRITEAVHSEIESTKTLEELEGLAGNLPDEVADDNSAIVAICDKMLLLSATGADCERVFALIPDDDDTGIVELDKRATLRLLEVASEFSDIADHLDNYTVEDGELVDKLLNKELELAESLDDCDAVQSHADDCSTEDWTDVVLLRKAELCKTQKEILGVLKDYDLTDTDDSILAKIFKHGAELSTPQA